MSARHLMASTKACGRPAHCGLCSKCRERHDGFLAARVTDPTLYATAPARELPGGTVDPPDFRASVVP